MGTRDIVEKSVILAIHISMTFQNLGLIPGFCRPGKCEIIIQDVPGSVRTL